MRSYGKFAIGTGSYGGIVWVPSSSGDFAVFHSNNNVIAQGSSYCEQFGRFARVDGFTQQALDDFAATGLPYQGPIALQSWTGLGLGGEIMSNVGFLNYVPYANHPLN